MSSMTEEVRGGVRDHVSAAEWNTRVQLAASYRALALLGVADFTYNHLSARVPDAPDHVLVKAEDQLFDEITASSLLKYDLDGNKVLGEGSLSRGGLVIHLGILQGRPDLNAVFHTHTPANMAVSAQKCGLLSITQHSVRFHNRIRYHDFGGFEFDFEGRKALLDSLGDQYAMIMRSHGVLVAGRTIPEAYVKHHFLEMSCRAQVGALTGGLDNVDIIAEDVAEHAAQQADRRPPPDQNHRDWKALIRQVDTHASSYRY
ncbi:class II aldolase/adducin family protein [soil metagenome]